MDLEGFLVLPGLINAHDHLEFNLFPQLGRGPYPNATAWANDIYRPEEPPVREQLQVPKALRLTWGGIKNLVAGVTSVLHHNPYEAGLFGPRFPVRVIRRFGWAHSLEFGGDIGKAYAGTPEGAPFLIHACEGTDRQAAAELYRLDSAGVLGSSTVIVHGVALDAKGLELVKNRGASLIWCPGSNYFTLGRSLSPEVLRSGAPIALGTDSALTCAGDLADEIALACREVPAEVVHHMVTGTAAKILRLSSGQGHIVDGGLADFVIVPDRGQTPAGALLEMRPEIVLVGGRIKLIAPALAGRFDAFMRGRFQQIEIEGRGRWLIQCDAVNLVEGVQSVLGRHVRLAGKGVAG